MRLTLGAIPSLLLLSACYVPIENSSAMSIDFALGQVDEACAQSGTSSSDQGSTTFEHSLIGADCVTSLAWDGSFIDFGSVKSAVSQALSDRGVDPAGLDVALDDVDIRVTAFSFQDALGNVIETSGDAPCAIGLDIGGSPDVLRVEGNAVGAPAVTLAADHALLVAEAQAAYDAGAALRGHAEGSVTVRAADVQQFSESQEGVVAHLDFVVTVDATATYHD